MNDKSTSNLGIPQQEVEPGVRIINLPIGKAAPWLAGQASSQPSAAPAGSAGGRGKVHDAPQALPHVKYGFDITKTLMVIHAYPKGKVTAPLLFWALQIGLTLEQIVVFAKRDIPAAYNTAIRDVALPSPYEHFIFADDDITPGPRTTDFLTATADVIGVECRHSTPNAWAEPDAIHTNMWRCRREVLTAVKPPWFQLVYTPDGCDIAKCLCTHFRDKVKAAGFTIVRAGWVEHEARTM